MGQQVSLKTPKVSVLLIIIIIQQVIMLRQTLNNLPQIIQVSRDKNKFESRAQTFFN